ncbi:MAG: DUF4102 domain-containing protein [Proteobacteria bacterium]|nr:DUF4102 domain-containing protein [Pseudomonadota bacterium]
MALTELKLKGLKPKAKTYRLADSNGLCIEVRPTGSKYWRYRYRFAGKFQMLALGEYPLVSLSDARQARNEAKLLLAQGKHPAREKKAEKIRKTTANENTFEAVARRWMAIKSKNLNPKYAKQSLERMEQHVFLRIGALPIADITIPDCTSVVERVGERGTIETAKRIKQLMGQIFRYAAQRGLCIHNPAADLRDILPSHKEKHHPCIHPSELPDLLKAMKAYKGDRLTVAAMHLLALTFVRTGELIGATWSEIDWSRAEWHIPKERMKMKRPHLVPLSRQAIAILKDLQTQTGEREHIFFSAAAKSKHISNGAVLMALRRMGYQGRMTGHGFRALASTILNEQGYAPDVIERQLAHEDADKIRSAYNRAEYLLERKKMMQDYADFLDVVQTRNSVIEGKFGKVVG